MGGSAMTMMHLNQQVRQFGGFSPCRRVSGRTPKMPICAVSNPNFDDFTNPVAEHTDKTHHLSGAIRQVRKESLTSYFSGELNLAPNKRIRASEMKNSVYARLLHRRDKSDAKGESR